jgi:uncharacterized protein (TIGR00730 family)
MNNKRQYVIDDLSIKESWRLFKIMAEFVDGFDDLGDLGPAVSIFGSARCGEDDQVYKNTETLSRLIAEKGYGIITGGGPGLMEAANKGAQAGGGKSVGLHIQLPHEQRSNDHIDLKIDFKYFFTRKVMFIKYAHAYVAMPGGLGTLDELSEALVLIQTKRIKPFPIVLMDSDFWEPLIDWFTKTLLERGYISKPDLELFRILDTPEEAAEFIIEHIVL